jgi:hypothetical protein
MAKKNLEDEKRILLPKETPKAIEAATFDTIFDFFAKNFFSDILPWKTFRL